MKALSRKACVAGLCGMAALLALPACERFGNGITARSEIGFSIPTAEKTPETKAETEARWAPLLADLAKQTGLTIKAVYADDYEAQRGAFQGRKVQAGWFENLSGAEAVTQEHGEVFAAVEGVDALQSLIIVPVESKLTPADLLKCDKRLSLALGDTPSTFDTPLYTLFQPAKVDPETCFKATRETGPDKAIAGVLKGTLSAAAIDSAHLLKVQQGDAETFKKLKVIWASEPLAEDVLIYREDLDPVTKEKLRSFFLSYGRAPGAEGDRQRAVLSRLGFAGFSPEDDGHFVPIRLMRASVELMKAERGGKAHDIETARQNLSDIQAEQRALDAKTAPQLLADPEAPASSAK
ncbi:phosphate/phosphite/phosphonate ABC transporter substrate-binding protein [Asticcacaulis benevestitus]|nr:phosphate/phosphite/phosphonate ABC transporter substrate-binding protein [Asticcacaulis benevestitus]